MIISPKRVPGIRILLNVNGELMQDLIYRTCIQSRHLCVHVYVGTLPLGSYLAVTTAVLFFHFIVDTFGVKFCYVVIPWYLLNGSPQTQTPSPRDEGKE